MVQLVLQMAPSDNTSITLDYIRSEFDLERSYSDLSAWFSNTAAVSQSVSGQMAQFLVLFTTAKS